MLKVTRGLTFRARHSTKAIAPRAGCAWLRLDCARAYAASRPPKKPAGTRLSAKQRRQRLALGETDRAVGLVADFARRVDPEAPEDRGREVGGGHRIAVGIGADPVAG